MVVCAIEANEETLIDVTATSILDRRAVLKGIQGMSAEESGKLLDELIILDQSVSSSF
jgi:hypothetical protein